MYPDTEVRYESHANLVGPLILGYFDSVREGGREGESDVVRERERGSYDRQKDKSRNKEKARE